MADADDSLKALWANRRQRSHLVKIDEMTLAAWFDAGCPEDDALEGLLSEDPAARELLSFLRDETPIEQMNVSSKTLKSLHASTLEHLRNTRTDRGRRYVIGSIGLQATAAAAAIVVAAIGFTFGQSAAPATNEATNNFIAAVTFDLLDTDSQDLESIILATLSGTREWSKDEQQ